MANNVSYVSVGARMDESSLNKILQNFINFKKSAEKSSEVDIKAKAGKEFNAEIVKAYKDASTYFDKNLGNLNMSKEIGRLARTAMDEELPSEQRLNQIEKFLNKLQSLSSINREFKKEFGKDSTNNMGIFDDSELNALIKYRERIQKEEQKISDTKKKAEEEIFKIRSKADPKDRAGVMRLANDYKVGNTDYGAVANRLDISSDKEMSRDQKSAINEYQKVTTLMSKLNAEYQKRKSGDLYDAENLKEIVKLGPQLSRTAEMVEQAKQNVLNQFKLGEDSDEIKRAQENAIAGIDKKDTKAIEEARQKALEDTQTQYAKNLESSMAKDLKNRKIDVGQSFLSEVNSKDYQKKIIELATNEANRALNQAKINRNQIVADAQARNPDKISSESRNKVSESTAQLQGDVTKGNLTMSKQDIENIEKYNAGLGGCLSKIAEIQEKMKTTFMTDKEMGQSRQEIGRYFDRAKELSDKFNINLKDEAELAGVNYEEASKIQLRGPSTDIKKSRESFNNVVFEKDVEYAEKFNLSLDESIAKLKELHAQSLSEGLTHAEEQEMLLLNTRISDMVAQQGEAFDITKHISPEEYADIQSSLEGVLPSAKSAKTLDILRKGFREAGEEAANTARIAGELGLGGGRGSGTGTGSGSGTGAGMGDVPQAEHDALQEELQVAQEETRQAQEQATQAREEAERERERANQAELEAEKARTDQANQQTQQAEQQRAEAERAAADAAKNQPKPDEEFHVTDEQRQGFDDLFDKLMSSNDGKPLFKEEVEVDANTEPAKDKLGDLDADIDKTKDKGKEVEIGSEKDPNAEFNEAMKRIGDISSKKPAERTADEFKQLKADLDFTLESVKGLNGTEQTLNDMFKTDGIKSSYQQLVEECKQYEEELKNVQQEQQKVKDGNKDTPTDIDKQKPGTKSTPEENASATGTGRSEGANGGTVKGGKIVVDDKEALEKIENVKTQLESIPDKNVKINAEISDQARTTIEEFTKVEEGENAGKTIPIKIDDSNVKPAVDGIREQLDSLQDKDITVNIKTGKEQIEAESEKIIKDLQSIPEFPGLPSEIDKLDLWDKIKNYDESSFASLKGSFIGNFETFGGKQSQKNAAAILYQRMLHMYESFGASATELRNEMTSGKYRMSESSFDDFVSKNKLGDIKNKQVRETVAGLNEFDQVFSGFDLSAVEKYNVSLDECIAKIKEYQSTMSSLKPSEAIDAQFFMQQALRLSGSESALDKTLKDFGIDGNYRDISKELMRYAGSPDKKDMRRLAALRSGLLDDWDIKEVTDDKGSVTGHKYSYKHTDKPTDNTGVPSNSSLSQYKTEITEISGLIDSLNEKKINIQIDENSNFETLKDTFEGISQSIGNFNLENLQSLSSILKNLSKESSLAENLNKVVEALIKLKEAMSSGSPIDTSFLGDIKGILSQGEALKDFAKVMSSSQKKIKEAKKQMKSDEQKTGDKKQQKTDREAEKAAKKAKKEDEQNRYRDELKKYVGSEDLGFGKLESVKGSGSTATLSFLTQVDGKAKEVTVSIKNMSEALNQIKAGNFQNWANDLGIVSKPKGNLMPTEAQNVLGGYKDYLKNTISGSPVTDTQKQAYEQVNAALAGIRQSGEGATAVMKEFANTANSIRADAIYKVTAEMERLDSKQGGTQKYYNTLDQIKQKIDEINNSEMDPNDEKEKNDLEQINQLLQKAESGYRSGEMRKAGSNRVASLQNRLSTIEAYNSRAVNSREFKDRFSSLKTRISGLTGDESVTDVQNLHGELDRLKTDFQDAGKSGMSFFDTWKQRMGSLGAYLLSFASFYDVINVIKQTGEAVRELDTAMVELQKVSDMSGSRLQQSFETSKQTAMDLGATVQETINATADWSRLGYSPDQAEELAKVAVVYEHVGDGIDIDAANQSLISTLQGFSMDASQAMEIVDKFNETANRMPIDSAGIGEALQRSAASFREANTDLSESIALITGAIKYGSFYRNIKQ